MGFQAFEYRGALRVVAGLVAVGAVFFGAQYLAARTGPVLELDVGPNTGAYLDGFTESEERVPVTFRWTRDRASITVPLSASGTDAVVYLRFARFLEGTASVRLFIDGEQQGVFSARSGRFRTLELPVSFHGERPTITLVVDDPDPERLGIAVDWLRIDNAHWEAGASLLRPAVLLVGVFLLVVALGGSVRHAIGVGVIVSAVQAVWFAHDPLAMVFTHDELTVVGLSSAALVAAVSLTLGRARSLALVFLLGYLLKGAALFHPSYWYPDVRLHRRYVESLDAAHGGLVERGIEAQKLSGTAYPRELGGRNYAMPYSPLFYVPFTLLDRDARGLESIMKHVGLLLAAAEVILVYLLAHYLLGARVAWFASVAALFLPPLMSRLLFAQWPTLTGHLLDVITIGLAARLLKKPDEGARLARYAAGVLAAFLTYITSLFTMTVFTGALATIERRRARALILVTALAATTTVVLLYLPFARAVVTEILPAVMAGAPSAGAEASGFLEAVGRIHSFYGFAFPAFAVGGLALARRDAIAFKTLVAYGATFAVLVTLRAVSYAFKDLKELVFVGPLIAITTGACLEALAARGRAGRFAAGAVLIGLAGFGLSKLGEYAALHTKLAGLD